MKKILTLLTLSVGLLATPLLQVAPSFSELEKGLLLEEFSKNAKASKEYTPKKGWNLFTAPNGGVDVSATFKDVSTIKFITTYDPKSKVWAMYAPNKNYPETKILFLKYLEPKVKFFVLATKDTNIDIKSTNLGDACKKLQEDPAYDFITDSGISREPTFSKDGSISIRSRYYSHNTKGLYSDTRVMLIYPKLKSKNKASLKYGPATPKVAFKFSKEYEAKKFYTYDYKEQKCYQGVFPSLRIPPFPVLKKLD